MSGISTHVLDSSQGRPVSRLVVTLEGADPSGWRELAKGLTDLDGRIASLLPGGVSAAGEYRLRFATGDYFRRLGQVGLYPEVAINVWLDPGTNYHLPLLLSPFGYSTYRGS